MLPRLNLSIQSKLMIMLLAMSVTAIGVISWIAYASARDAVTVSAFDHLTSLRASKKIQIEALFAAIRKEVSNLAADRMIVAATSDFAAGFDAFRGIQIKPEWDRDLHAYYQDDFLPKLGKQMQETPRLQAFWPAGAAARYLQYLYIAKNPDPAARYKLDDAGDGSAYSKSHALYQPVLARFVQDFGYNNLMLIDYATGDVVYTFTKSPILGTNLLDGPYSNTSAGDLFRMVRGDGASAAVRVIDFAPMPSALNEPVALMGTQVMGDHGPIGVLFVQFPVDEINRVMTDDFHWVADGYGATGETYLVGADKFMRSRSRLLHESADGYYAALKAAGYPPEDIERVRRAGTATLAQRADTPAVNNALAGETGTAILPNYLRVPTLTSYAPLTIPGLHWVIVADMRADEAFAPLVELSHRVLTGATITILLVTVVAAIFGRRFVRPITRLVDGVRRLKAGERNVVVETGSNDEFAEVGAAFNRIAARISATTASLEHVMQERQQLLNSVLPAEVVDRTARGATGTVDEHAELSVLYCEFLYQDGGSTRGDEALLTVIDNLVVAIEQSANQRGIESLSNTGMAYVAACGMGRQRLDHASRTIDLANDILRIARRLQRDRQVGLHARIGIASGAAAGRVMGRTRFSYHLAGEPMAMACLLASHATRGTVVVAEQVFAATRNLYSFDRSVQIVTDDGETVEAWPILASERDNRDTPRSAVVVASGEPAAAAMSSPSASGAGA